MVVSSGSSSLAFRSLGDIQSHRQQDESDGQITRLLLKISLALTERTASRLVSELDKYYYEALLPV
jgi:hypothetical protein